MTQRQSLYARVHGLVQGVGFRYGAVVQARRLGLIGYARNMPDGSVEVVAEGDRRRLETMLAWLKHGPSMARVTRVEHRFLPYSGNYRNFGVAY